ncbi:type I restriction modification DNA specificity domain protein [Rickettsia bellii str. RML Mogi]|uniref:Type I restriction modification DNA specificity domain protein n=1 Tax=Rickettsia bellii str. RML Mogi TaxID=1359194 RepID=A0A0F3QJJ3_RICBE|nr:type I restriction modification DNA specificity domain protein [Rickettsia bellii str. RML Mogi]
MYFENCLAWNREGSVGYVFYHKNKFTTNDHHRPMIIKEEYIQILDIEYMRYAIEKVLLSQGFKWSKTASKEKVANLSVSIPITSTGKFDIEKQKEIIATHKKIEEIKNSTFDELRKIQEYSLII